MTEPLAANDYSQNVGPSGNWRLYQTAVPGPPGLKGGGDGGTFSGMPPDLPERVAKLETHIEHMNRNIATLQTDVRDIRRDMNADFRYTWGGLILGGLMLLGTLAKGFKWI